MALLDSLRGRMNAFSPLNGLNRAQLLRFLAYSLYFFVCLVTFAYCTFPYERVRDRIETEVERALPGSDLEIVSLEPSFLTGAVASGISLTFPKTTEDEPPTVMSLDDVSVRVGVLSYLAGEISASFSTTLGGGGTIEGAYSDSAEATHVVAHLDSIALGRIGPLRRYVSLPLTGTLNGDIDLTIAEQVENTTGNVTLTATGLALGDGRARLALPGMGSGVTIERVDAGTLNFRMQVEHGVGRIQQLSASSDDIDIRGAGTVRFIRPVRMSSLDLLLRIDIKQPYRERNDRTRAVFSLLDMSPQAGAFRAPDGALQLRLAGSFGSSIRAAPAGSATVPQ